MKRYFITKRVGHIVPKGYEIGNDFSLFLEAFTKAEEFALDTEYNHLDTVSAELLLVSIAIPEITVVIDATSVDLSPLKVLEDILMICHNVKVDHQMMYKKGIDFKNLYCTMIMEQRYNMGSGVRNALDIVHKRRLGIEMIEDKNVRTEFANVKQTFVFQERHIRYSGYDAECLLPIKKSQIALIEKANFCYLLYNIEFPFARCLSLSELEGTIIDKDQVALNIETCKDSLYDIECELDAILENLANKYPNLKNKYKTKRRNKIKSVEQTDLFGDSSIITPKRINNINYGSNEIVGSVFRLTESIMPIDPKNQKQGVGEGALLDYLIQFPKTNLRSFIEGMLKYREYTKELSNYGYKFLSVSFMKDKALTRGYINKDTGRAHTIYRQCVTETGRLASGESGSKKKNKTQESTGSKENKELGTPFPRYNSQNMPKKEEYRKIVIAPKGQFITTADYSAMELVIAGSLSGDEKLIEIHDKDMHSYLATKCYTDIIKDILLFEGGKENKTVRFFTFEAVKQVLWTTQQEAPDEIVNKALDSILNNQSFEIRNFEEDDEPNSPKYFNHLKYMRTDFKSLVYGILYGSTVKRIMQVLNISLTNAKIVDRRMRKEMPMLFAYLDEVSHFGASNGYIIFNKVTNSRHIFKSWVEARRYNAKLSNGEVATIERACKNYPIQGTSADITKEAAVNLTKHIDKYKLDANILLYVHDELVVRHKDKDLGSTIKLIMEETADKYLNGVTMKATYKTLTHWTK